MDYIYIARTYYGISLFRQIRCLVTRYLVNGIGFSKVSFPTGWQCIINLWTFATYCEWTCSIVSTQQVPWSVDRLCGQMVISVIYAWKRSPRLIRLNIFISLVKDVKLRATPSDLMVRDSFACNELCFYLTWNLLETRLSCQCSSSQSGSRQMGMQCIKPTRKNRSFSTAIVIQCHQQILRWKSPLHLSNHPLSLVLSRYPSSKRISHITRCTCVL